MIRGRSEDSGGFISASCRMVTLRNGLRTGTSLTVFWVPRTSLLEDLGNAPKPNHELYCEALFIPGICLH